MAKKYVHTVAAIYLANSVSKLIRWQSGLSKQKFMRIDQKSNQGY